MHKLKEKIAKNIDIVLRQYKLENWDEERNGTHPYYLTLKKLEEEFISNDISKIKKGVKGFESLLLSYRAWEDGYHKYFADRGDKYKDKFIDNFNNWTKWYAFLESLVKDAKEYYKQQADKGSH